MRDITADPSSARQPTGSSSPGTIASASALFGATGPPRKTTDGPVTRSVQDSRTCPTGTSVGRLSTTPSVPSSGSSSTMRTTVRRKFGSPSNGVATSSRPESSSSMPTILADAAVVRAPVSPARDFVPI